MMNLISRGKIGVGLRRLLTSTSFQPASAVGLSKAYSTYAEVDFNVRKSDSSCSVCL